MSKNKGSKTRNIKNFNVNTNNDINANDASSNSSSNVSGRENVNDININANANSEKEVSNNSAKSATSSSGDAQKTTSRGDNIKHRAIKTFVNKTQEGIENAEASNRTSKDEENNEFGTKYQNDFNGLGSNVQDGAKRVKKLMDDIRRNDLTKKRNAGNMPLDASERGAQNSMLNNGRPFGDVSPVERRPIVDSKNIEVINDAKRQEINKELLDSRFGKPKKKEGLSKLLKRRKNEWIGKKKAQIAKAKSKGIVNGLAEKVGGASAKGIFAFVLKIILIIILILLLLTFIIAIIFYFSNNYTREQDNISDSKRLDTRVERAIYDFKEQAEFIRTYKELKMNATGNDYLRYDRNFNRLVPSEEVEKFKAAEDPESGFILQDGANWILLYLERLSYAWGGYLDWIPEYLDLGINMQQGGDVRNPSTANLAIWEPICREVGNQYGIDPAIIMTMFDIESSGNPHAGNANYKGLGALPADFQGYFKEGEKYKNWSADMRIPSDFGTCDWTDEIHQDTGRMHATYIARRLTQHAGQFLKNVKGTSIQSASKQDKSLAMVFAIMAYNQGFAGQSALYKDYGPSLYSGDGSYYTRIFKKHLTVDLSNGRNTIGEGNATYLQLAYKFYKEYSHGNDLLSLGDNTNPARWYGNTEGGNPNKNQVDSEVPGSVVEPVKLVKGSPEIELVNEIRRIHHVGKLQAIVDKYNRWMKKLDTYYMARYPEKFLTDDSGHARPELYAKDLYGIDTPDVIKHMSHIHTIIDIINTYITTKSYDGDSVGDAYAKLKTDLYNEYNEGPPIVTKEPSENLGSLEGEIALNRYELSFEVIRTVDADNDIFKNTEAMDTIQNSLSYGVPIYEYVTTNMVEANKSFFNYELYQPQFYNPNFTLKIDKSKFLSKINDINKINVSMKSFVKNGWTEEGEASITNRMEQAFENMYLSDNMAYESRNHASRVPEDIKTYYIVNKYGMIFDKMIEKVRAVEVYTSGSPGPGQRVEWREVGSEPGPTYFQQIDSRVERDYYVSSLKPDIYTSLKYQINYSYIKEEEGDREIDTKTPEIRYFIGTVYEKSQNADGSEGSESKVGELYKKEITRNSYYIIAKVRNKEIKKRGVVKENV